MTNDELDKYFDGTVPKDAVEIAGLYASIGHLSALVDEQRKLLSQALDVLEDVFGKGKVDVPIITAIQEQLA